jgi:O-antigen/teichoic acid export membrane protein
MIRRALSSASIRWSLLDQGLVSGFNFAIGVLLARQLGLAAFGAYVIAQTYMQYAGTIQSALVVVPMMSAVPLERDPAAQHTMLRGFFAYAIAILLVTSAGVTLIAWLVGQWSATLSLGRGTEVIPLCAAMVSSFFQDWPRRALYARSAARAVFFSDLAAYGGQWCLLIALASRGGLTLDIALWVLTASFAISAVGTVAAVGVSPDFRAMPAVIRAHGRSGRDYLFSAQLQWLGASGVIMAGTGFIGIQAAAAIRATQNLLGPFNVLFQWMENVMPVRSALRLREGGREQLALYLNRLSWIGFLAIGAFAVLSAPVDGWLMQTIYGAAYRPFGMLVVIQALYFTFGHLYRMQTYYSRSLGRAADVARSSLWWAIVAISSAVLTVNLWAERGIMIALVAGEVAAILYLVWLRYSSDPPAARTDGWYLQWQGAGRMGRMRLVLPLANNRVLRGALRMYSPSRWTGKLYRPALAASLPVFARSGFGRLLQGGQSWCVHLPSLAQMVPGARIECVGGLQATAGSQSKVTLRLMDEYGNALAYARVAHDPSDVQTVSGEARVLTAVGATDVSTQAPRLIGHGPLADPNGYFLLESAGPEKTALAQLDERHFRFLHGLMRNGAIRSWDALLEQIAGEAELICHSNAAARLALTHLQRLRLPAMPECIGHGDFAPWNIREQTSGELFVLDWDRADLHGVPWLDALHYCFQVETLVRRQPAAAVVRCMKAVFVEPSAGCYARAVGPTADVSTPLMFLYLLRTLARDIWDQPSLTFDELPRVRVLEQLLREENLCA